MWQNMEVVNTSNYSLEMVVQEYLRISHDDLFNSPAVKVKNRSHWPIWSLLELLTDMDPKSTPSLRDCIPLATSFTKNVIGNFH